ncbi:hypothetical protein [Nocardia farcinica]|uniref:hypothetical protein n=1 Tax=Nocardia farcinica TaxID=37329 RepID=UPI001893C635|nr:hypothetical protein [Nocardia farcinica]MBF6410956.1 hypothetical protein [Nocardia farcinica]
MTAPGISIPITADGSGFDDELRRVVVDAMRDVQRQLDIDPLTASVRGAFDGSSLATDLQSELRAIQRTDPHISVRGEFDSAGLISEIETAVAGAGRTIKFGTDIQVDAADLAAVRELQSMPDKTIRVDVALGMSEADAKRLRSIASTLRQMQALTDVSVRVRVNLDMSPAELERLKQIGPVVRSLRTLTDKDVRVRVKLDMSPAELERLTQIAPALRSLRGLSDKDVKIKIDIQVDEAQLQRIAALLRELRSGSANFRFNSNADTEASRVDRLRDSLRSVGIGAGGMAAVAAAIAGIGGAAGLAAGAVGGLVVAAAALGPGIAAAVGTATVALAGVKDAFDAAAAAAEAGPGEAAAAAKATAAAQQQLQSAADAAADAQRNLTDAQADAEEATRAIGDAYQAAADELEDWQFKLRGSVLDQKEAALALKDAQRDVFDAKTPQERERALLRVERAQLNYDKAVADGRDVAEQAADAERKGLDNSDKVVAARKAAADAEDRVTQARRAAEQAERQVAAAAAALTEAQTAGTASSQKLAEAMAKLAPNAQDFVRTARELAPAWEEVRKSVQDTAFQGAGEGLRQLADTVLPTLRDGMTAVAAEMNAGAHGFAAFLKSTEGIEGLQAAFAIAANGLRGLREGSDGFLAGLSAMAEASAPFAEQIGRAFGSIGTALGDAFSFVAESGLLGDVLDGLTVALQGLGPLLGDLFVSLARIAADVMPALGPLLESLGQALVTMAPALGQVGAVFAQSLTLIMPILGDFIADLTAGLAPVLPVIAGLLGVLLDAVQPLIEPLAQVAVVVGSALAQAIQALAPAIGPLGEAFAALVTAVAPLIPLFAESLSAVLQALAPALTQVATALAPVIAQFADQMRPVIAQVAPILAEVAMTLGMALADAIRQIAPVLPQIVTAFTNLLMAILPLLPELVRLAAELLPPLLNILVELSPVLVKLIEAFTWLVQNVLIPIVMPVIRQLADEFKTAMDRIGDVIRWVKDELFPSLGNAIDTVKGWFEKGVDGITGAWDRLKESAAKPVRYVVNTVWNEGLLKAWNAVRQFLPGVEPMEPVTLGFRRGGGVFGPGTGTSDSIPAWLSAGEHVVTAAEVLKAGGQNVLYAIRDMIARGIPFTWDGGRVISLLGRENLAAYGAAVRERGIGNVSPEGLFDALLPKFRDGGAVMPWMHQLARGHDFARSQHGKPYQWAGPRFQGDSFDCCLVGDTMVYGPDGACPISEVRPGFRVWSYVAGRRVASTVTAQWFSKRQATFKVRTRNKQVTGSANHPFMRLVRVEKWHPVKGGRKGEIVPDRWDVEWARLDELRRGDLLITPKDMGTEPKPLPTLADGTPVDADVAWLVGLFIGDGWTSERDVRICVYGERRERAERILRRLGASSTGHGDEYGVFAYGVELARTFAALNQGRRSFEKRVPDEVWLWPAELQRAFVDGYCEADGHRPASQTRHGQRTYASSSRLLVEEVRALHMMLGDPVSNISTNHRRKPITIKGKRVKNARPLHSFTVWQDGSRKGLTALTQNNRGIGVWLESGEFTLSPVLGIEDQGEQDTYDIEVGGSHNFVADGVIVHNSGFMGSIIAAILGLNPWTRYWSTSTFAGYPARGAQGLVKGLREGVGMLVGITDDPGGPGGGHTAGELRGIPELGYPTARVESDGSRGVHYGFGTPVTSFASLYGLPIGANGFFQPSTGGDTVGPSTDEQRGFVARMVAETVKRFTNPIRETMTSVIGPPPPRWKEIPPEFLTTAEDKTVEYLSGLVTNLGDTLPAAWAKARDLAGSVLDALNPFDSGGIATGTGFMPKNVIAPERVLSPQQTRLFETLVLSLQQLAGHRVVDSAPEPLTAAVFQQGIDHLARVLGVAQEPVTPELTAAMESSRAAVDETGRVLGTVRDLADRTESSQDRVLAEQFEQMQAVLGDIGQRLTSGVLMPIMESAVTSGVRFIEQWLGAAADQITASTDQTTQAVENLDTGGDATAPAPFGAPGSAFDAVTAISDAVVSVAQTAQQAFQQVAQDVANAALAQQASRVDNSRGVLGRDISGGPLVDMLVRLTGVEIEIRDTLVDTWEEIRSFRGDLVKAFDTSGRIVADTADLMQRNESSRELVISEQNRINRELIKALLRYLMTSVVIPILSAILGVMIQLAVTAIGAAIGSIIPGIGTAIGAAIGAVVGAALAGAAAVFTSALAIGAGAAIDAFDSGGVALGKGVMVKDTIAPERVLSPRQTEAFDRLVAALEKGGNRTVNAPMTVYEGAGAGSRIQNDLMSLL